MVERRVLLWCVLVSLGGACAGGEDNFPVPIPGGDGSLPERVVATAVSR